MYRDKRATGRQHLRIVIHGASSAGICGSLTWGTAAPPAPASDPAAIYPSSDYWRFNGVAGATGVLWAPPIEGFPYTITQGGERLPTLRLAVQKSEPWKSWCELQTPVGGGGDWNCIQPDATSWRTSDDGPDASCVVSLPHGTASYSAFQCSACLPAAGGDLCACGADRCDAEQQRQQTFDLTLSPDEESLSGTLTLVDTDGPG